MNPTTDVLEQRWPRWKAEQLALELPPVRVRFYSIINLAQEGDEIISANNLYGGTYTQFNDILPKFGINVKFVDPNDPANLRRCHYR